MAERENTIRPGAVGPAPGRADDPVRDPGVTVRSIVYGLCLVLAISVLGNTVRYILHSSFMAYSHMPMGNLILVLLSILACSALARRFGRAFVFSPSEWMRYSLRS